MSQDSLLKPSEIADLAKILPSKIRHYTELGILKPAAYTDGGFKLYDKTETLDKLKQVTILSEKGMTLDQIRDEMNRPSDKRRALVVDDDDSVITFYELFFPQKFPTWEVKIANNGFEAGRIISDWTPDLVILDLMMPGISGFQVCKNIRNDPSLAQIKILAVTGYYGTDSKEKVMSIGANDYMTKPMETNKLVERISKLMDINSNGKYKSIQ